MRTTGMGRRAGSGPGIRPRRAGGERLDRGVRAASLLLALLAGGATGAMGQERFDETRPLRPGGILEVRVVAHEIRLEPWDREEVQIRGEYDPEWERLDIQGSGSAVSVEIRHLRSRGGRHTSGQRVLEIRLPREVRLEATTVSGSVQGSALRGSVTVTTVSGGIRLAALQVETASATTVSGNVEVDGRASEVRSQTVSGRVRVRAETPMVVAKSVSGDVVVEGTIPFRRAELGAVSGRIEFQGALAPGGDLHAESHSGGVDLALSREVGARFHLSTFSGSVRVDLDAVRDRREERGRFSPGETVTFVTGDGAGRVEARSFSGSVRVRSGGE